MKLARLLFIWFISLFINIQLCLAVQIASGTYLGDGNDDRVIDIGFQPSFVFIISENYPGYPIWRTSQFDAGESQEISNTSGIATTNLIQAFPSNGFEIGDDDKVNNNGYENYYLAIKDDGSNDVKLQEWDGNSTDNRAFTGFGFSPILTFIQAEDYSGGKGGIWKSSNMGGDSLGFFHSSSTCVSSTCIKSLDADGFTVGTNAYVNETGTHYHSFSIASVSGFVTIGKYIGDGTTNREITDPSFDGNFIWIRRLCMSGESMMQVRTSDTRDGSDDWSLQFPNSLMTTDKIKEFIENGFKIGDTTFNWSNGRYFYFYVKGNFEEEEEETSRRYVNKKMFW